MCADFLEKNYDRVSLVYRFTFGPCVGKKRLHVFLLICQQIFTEYEKLLHSENYVTKRQSLKVGSSLFKLNFMFKTHCVGTCCCKHTCVFPLHVFQLLGELLLDRHNFTVMTKYISKAENLKLMMNMLRDKSRNIQFEAFHVFKVSMQKTKQKH